jgi:type IV pilus assembly protein PilO
MIRPANAEMANQKAKLLEKQAKLRKLQSAPVAAEELKEQLGRLSQAVTFFESKLPDASEIETVLQDVTVIAKKNKLTSKMIRTLKTKRNNGYIELPLKMELQGDFKSYYSFLLELEQLDRITKIRELNLKKDDDNQGQINASFVVSIFFQGA